MGIIGRHPPPCPECHALGSFTHEGTAYQLYLCLLRLHSLPIVDPNWPTVMARFGDGPEDFTDGIGLADRDPVLAEAKRRAVEHGLLDPNRELSPLMEPAVHALANLIVKDLLRDAAARSQRMTDGDDSRELEGERAKVAPSARFVGGRDDDA